MSADEEECHEADFASVELDTRQIWQRIPTDLVQPDLDRRDERPHEEDGDHPLRAKREHAVQTTRSPPSLDDGIVRR
jgi:hypothetical protein